MDCRRGEEGVKGNCRLKSGVNKDTHGGYYTVFAGNLSINSHVG